MDAGVCVPDVCEFEGLRGPLFEGIGLYLVHRMGRDGGGVVDSGLEDCSG